MKTNDIHTTQYIKQYRKRRSIMQKEQLQQLTQEANALGNKLQALNDEELSMVIGGIGEDLQQVITRVTVDTIKEKQSKLDASSRAASALGQVGVTNDKI